MDKKLSDKNDPKPRLDPGTPRPKKLGNSISLGHTAVHGTSDRQSRRQILFRAGRRRSIHASKKRTAPRPRPGSQRRLALRYADVKSYVYVTVHMSLFFTSTTNGAGLK